MLYRCLISLSLLNDAAKQDDSRQDQQLLWRFFLTTNIFGGTLYHSAKQQAVLLVSDKSKFKLNSSPGNSILRPCFMISSLRYLMAAEYTIQKNSSSLSLSSSSWSWSLSIWTITSQTSWFFNILLSNSWKWQICNWWLDVWTSHDGVKWRGVILILNHQVVVWVDIS